MELKEKVNRLKQLRHLKREVGQLSQRIAGLEGAIEANAASRWRGRAQVDHGARLIALRNRLADRRVCCMEQLGALYGFIDDIDDSLIRQIMACRYIDGLTWREVAVSIGERDEQYPRRLHNRWLKGSELPARFGAGGSDGRAMEMPEGGNVYGKAN